ncbi:hypothetical protein MAR_019299, partial [Mya arenaria]
IECTYDGCSLYETIFEKCPYGFECFTNGTHVMCRQTSKDLFDLVLGTVFGGTAFVVLLALFVVGTASLRRRVDHFKSKNYHDSTPNSLTINRKQGNTVSNLKRTRMVTKNDQYASINDQ